MEYSFSENARALKPSAIREILKMSAAPGIIPFSAGNPSPEAFPSREVAQITQNFLQKIPSQHCSIRSRKAIPPAGDPEGVHAAKS